MEIKRYCCYILMNCILIPYLLSKPISLNELIAAEEKRTSVQLPISKTTETSVRGTKPNKHKLPTAIITKHMTTGTITPNKKVSPLKYKKTFQIRTPLRPKKIRHSYKPRSRRINLNTKREINKHDKFNRNYIPLLKSLSDLFNNILGSYSGEDDDMDQTNYRRRQISSNEECPCATKSEYKTREPNQTEKAITSTPFVSSTISTKTVNLSQASSTPTNNSVVDNIGAIRQHKNLSILPTRNTTGRRRNNNGFSKGGIPSHHRNLERHIARYNGSDESYNSGGQEAESYTEDNKGHPDGAPRDDASRDGHCGTIGRNRNITKEIEYETTTIETDIIESHETSASDRGDGDQFERYDKFETRSNKTESGTFLSQSHTRLRGNISQKETAELSWQVQGSEEGTFNVAYNITSNQRIPDRDGSMATEDQEFRRTNKTITVDDDIYTSVVNATPFHLGHDKQKIVMIYDGYSIARDVNGDNKMTEKLYRIHS